MNQYRVVTHDGSHVIVEADTSYEDKGCLYFLKGLKIIAIFAPSGWVRVHLMDTEESEKE